MIDSLIRRGMAFAAMIAALGSACASSSTRSSIAAADPAVRIDSDVITTAELNRLTPGLSAMAAIEYARPRFLRSRGSVSAASIDGSPPADLSVLQAIPAADVREIRLMRRGGGAPAAILGDGTVVVGDVILVLTGKRRNH
jgi:hypothetical protein